MVLALLTIIRPIGVWPVLTVQNAGADRIAQRALRFNLGAIKAVRSPRPSP